MIESLRKALQGAKPAASEVVTDVAELTAKLESASAELALKVTALAASESKVTELLSLVEQAAASHEAFEAKIAELNAQVASFTELVASKAAAELEAKMTARKAELSKTIGDAKAESMFAATKDLSDEAFKAVVTGFATTLDKEAASSLFNESGVADPADTSLITESAEMQHIKEKYSAAK